MGEFSEIVRRAGSVKPEDRPEVWHTHFPLLEEAMFPLPGKATGTWLSPRYTVTVFQDGGELKAVVGAKEGPRKYWVTLDGPEAVLEQVELCIKSGKGQWRDAKDQD